MPTTKEIERYLFSLAPKELALDWEQKTYQVLSWKVYHQEDYEIDQSIPVWSGN